MELVNSKIRNKYSISQKKFKEIFGISVDETIIEVENTSYFGGLGPSVYDVEVTTEKINKAS